MSLRQRELDATKDFNEEQRMLKIERTAEVEVRGNFLLFFPTLFSTVETMGPFHLCCICLGTSRGAQGTAIGQWRSPRTTQGDQEHDE